MKKSILCLLNLIIVFSIYIKPLHAQTDTSKAKKFWLITTNDGGEFMGEIISQDSKEVLILTKDRGEISIPKYQIKEMKELKENDMSQNGEYLPDEVFSTRYFITTNGLPIKKGESYILWSLYGPDFEFGVAKNFSVGVITSWFAYPLIGNAKYSYALNKKISIAGGLMVGTSTWGSGNFFYGFSVPYGTITYGDRKSNISLSAGMCFYDVDESSGNRPLGSLSAMNKVGKKVSLIFDSFLLLPNNNNDFTGVLIPGIRLQTNADKAFQIGFAGIIAQSEAFPIPIPYIQWFKKL